MYQKLKIAMVLSNPFVNDPRVFKEAKALVGNGYEVTVFAWDRRCKYPRYEEKDGIIIRRVRIKSLYKFGLLQLPGLFFFSVKAICLILRSKFSIIHCHDLETTLVGFVAKKLSGAKFVFDAHEVDYYAFTHFLRNVTVQLARIIEKLSARTADIVLITDVGQKEKYERHKNPEKIIFVPNYLDLSFLSARRQKENDKTGEKTFTIGKVGSFYSWDGTEEIIEATAILLSKGYSVNLLLAGTCASANKKEIERRLKKINPEYLKVTGKYDYSQLPEIYSDIDISLIPSHVNSVQKFVTHTKFFEALYYQTPVIVTPAGEISRIIEEERCGIVIDSSSPEKIAGAVEVLIADPLLIKTMGENGKRAVLEKYNWDVSAKNLIGAYVRLRDERLN